MPLDSIIYNATLDDIKQQMIRLVNESVSGENVRSVAISVTTGGDPIPRLYEFVKNNVKFIEDADMARGRTRDPENTEQLTNPEWAMYAYTRGMPVSEDCDGHATIVAALAQSIGVPARIAIVDYDFDGDYDHAFAQLWSDELGWVNVDTTSDYPLGWIYTVREITYVEF